MRAVRTSPQAAAGAVIAMKAAVAPNTHIVSRRGRVGDSGTADNTSYYKWSKPQLRLFFNFMLHGGSSAQPFVATMREPLQTLGLGQQNTTKPPLHLSLGDNLRQTRNN
jgi:hypothetical protein